MSTSDFSHQESGGTAQADAASAAHQEGHPDAPPQEQSQAELEARLASMSDAYLRAKAEAENIRRRAEEEASKGVRATLRQLAQALERNKVLPIEPAAGTRFDPHQHQAISVVPAEQDPNTVVSVLQKGYLIAERVLRPALVTVAAPK